MLVIFLKISILIAEKLRYEFEILDILFHLWNVQKVFYFKEEIIHIIEVLHYANQSCVLPIWSYHRPQSNNFSVEPSVRALNSPFVLASQTLF